MPKKSTRNAPVRAGETISLVARPDAPMHRRSGLRSSGSRGVARHGLFL